MFKVIKVMSTIPEPHIYIVRHGHTALNESSGTSVDRIRGWVDVPLNDEGRKDAENSRKKLVQNKVEPDKIYASNLGRTEETATIINQVFKVEIVDTINLRPWNLGDLQGKETSKVMHLMDMYAKAPDHPVPNGEPFNVFKKRYLAFLQKVTEEAKDKGLTIILVTHFRNVKLAQAWISAGMKPDLEVDEAIMKTKGVEPGDVFKLPIKW